MFKTSFFMLFLISAILYSCASVAKIEEFNADELSSYNYTLNIDKIQTKKKKNETEQQYDIKFFLVKYTNRTSKPEDKFYNVDSVIVLYSNGAVLKFCDKCHYHYNYKDYLNIVNFLDESIHSIKIKKNEKTYVIKETKKIHNLNFFINNYYIELNNKRLNISCNIGLNFNQNCFNNINKKPFVYYNSHIYKKIIIYVLFASMLLFLFFFLKNFISTKNTTS